MQLYKFKVQLNSNVMHQVWKTGTVPEIVVLRNVHASADDAGGFAAVTEISPIPGKKMERRVNPDDPTDTRMRPITDKEERARLEGLYGAALRKNQNKPGKPSTLVDTFGFDAPLPQTTDGVEPIVTRGRGKKASDSDELMQELA